jgi:hypothetical protein
VDDVAFFDRAARRLLAKVDAFGDCHLWTGSTTPSGYGRFLLRGVQHNVHRAAWLLFVGPIPEGYEIDHELHCNLLCVRLDHLRCVPKAVNLANRSWTKKADACGKGHSFTPENTGHNKLGHRFCRQCSRDGAAKRRTAA